MKFVIIGFDGPEGEARRKIYRPAHLAKMEPLDQAGRVVLAGPLTDKTGSLIVIEADSLEEARKFAQEDPYTVHGIPSTVSLSAWKSIRLSRSFPRPVSFIKSRTYTLNVSFFTYSLPLSWCVADLWNGRYS